MNAMKRLIVKHSHFQAMLFETYHFAFISRGVTVRVAIVHQLHLSKKNGLKAEEVSVHWKSSVFSGIPKKMQIPSVLNTAYAEWYT